MTTSVLSSSLLQATKARMGRDLLWISEKNAQMNLFRLQNGDKEIVVPYYYGKMLAMNQLVPFDTLEAREPVYMPINQHSTHRRIDFGISFELTKRQQPILAEVNRQVRRRGALTLKACTGFGKSMALIYMSGILKWLTLVYVTGTTYLTQIADAYRNDTNAVVWIPSKKNQTPPPNVQVILVMPKRIKYVPKDILDAVGTVIVDETHLICTPEFIKPLFLLQPRYLLTMSATITKRGQSLRELELLCGSYHIEVPLEVPIRMIKINTNIKVPVFTNAQGLDWNQHLEYLATNKQRNAFVAKVLADIMALNGEPTPDNPMHQLLEQFDLPDTLKTRPKSKIITVLANIKDHQDALTAELKEQNLTSDYVDGSKHRYNDCDVLMGVFGKVGTGFDQKSSCIDFRGDRFSWVVPTLSFAQEEVYSQLWGRGCRSEVCFVIFFQDNHAVTKKHWKNYVFPLLSRLKDTQVIEVKKYGG